MLDSKLLRTELDETAAKLARRGFALDVDTLRQLEVKRKSIQVDVENLQSTRNSISKQIGQKMAAGDKEGAEAIKQQIGTLGADLDAKKVELADVQSELEAIALRAEAGCSAASGSGWYPRRSTTAGQASTSASSDRPGRRPTRHSSSGRSSLTARAPSARTRSPEV